jgi:hypothetical protein
MIKTWNNRDGSSILIADMDNRHLINSYRYIVRMICCKVRDVDSCDAALEDGNITDEEHAFYNERSRRDLLDFLEQKDAVAAEVARRGLRI